jgi:hypothetical protein
MAVHPTTAGGIVAAHPWRGPEGGSVRGQGASPSATCWAWGPGRADRTFEGSPVGDRLEEPLHQISHVSHHQRR